MQKGLILKDSNGVIRNKFVLAGDWEPTKNQIQAELLDYTIEVYDDTDTVFVDAVVIPTGN